MNSAVLKFIDYLKVQKNYSSFTLLNYKKDIEEYEMFLKEKNYNYKNMDYKKCTEYLLFLVMITTVEKIEFTKNNYLNCQNVYRLIRYIEKTKDFVLKENEKDQKEDKEKFHKQ